MGWLFYIIEWFYQLSREFYWLARETYDWPDPLWWINFGFTWVANICNNIASELWYAAWWGELIQNAIQQILNWETIQVLFKGWIPNLLFIRDWFYRWQDNITGEVNRWWSEKVSTVKDWIDIAVQPFNDLFLAWGNFWNNTWPNWVTSFNSLKSAWDNFWKVTLPGLVKSIDLSIWFQSFRVEVDGLISSAFNTHKSLWEGWQDIKGNVFDFFDDPVEYIWERFADWFLGPEG